MANYDRVIEPGKTGRITADLRTAGYRGRIVKLIDVSSNDLETPHTSLRLVANILSAITVLPAETAVVSLKSDGPTVHEMEIRTSGKEAVDIERLACSVPYAEAKLTLLPAPPDGGKAYRVTLTVQPQAPLGRSILVMTAYTTSPKEPQVTVTAICDKGILAMPMSLYLGTITASTSLPVMQVVSLVKNNGTFHIRKVATDDPRLEAQAETLKEGAQYRLSVRYRGGWPAGAARSRITVETDDPLQPRLEIPVVANVAAGAAGGR